MNQRIMFGFCALTLSLAVCVVAQDKAGIIAKYSGRYSTLAVDDQGKEVSIAGHKVIHSQKEYVDFVSGIPTKEIAMVKGFAGKSDDPLLAMPKVDFSNQVIVAVVRDGSMYLPPDIESVSITNGILTVQYSERDLKEVAGLQELGGIGTYCAAVVPKPDGKVEFKKKAIKITQPTSPGDSSTRGAGLGTPEK